MRLGSMFTLFLSLMIGFVDIDAMLYITDLVFEDVVTDCNLGIIEILLCRVGRVENDELTVRLVSYVMSYLCVT